MLKNEQTIVDLRDFLKELRKAGHREGTVKFVEYIAGMEVDRGVFITRYKQAMQVRCPRSKANNLYNYLVDKGVIRTNER